MRAEIIFTGTELLLGQTLNTNAVYLQQVLASLGIDLFYQVTAGDNLERLSQAIAQARQRADLIIMGGGLGPTEDDLSREALADALGMSLHVNEQALQVVRRFFTGRNIRMADNNLKQALVPEQGIVLDNPVGTAPGIILEHMCKTYILLPGPPSELRLMVDEQMVPYLLGRLGEGRNVISSRVLKLCGIGESTVDERLGELLRNSNPTVAPTAKAGEVHLRITSKAKNFDEAAQLNAGMEDKIRGLLGEHVFGTDEETLADAVGRVLAARGMTLATVETISAGLLAHRLASAPDAAQFYKAGYVLGREEGSWPTLKPGGGKDLAGQLAAWGRSQAMADICVAVTGQEKGRLESTAYIATNMRELTRSKEFVLWGTARDVAERAAQTALTLLWRID